MKNFYFLVPWNYKLVNIIVIFSIFLSSSFFTQVKANSKQNTKSDCRVTTTDTPLFLQRSTTSQQIGSIVRGNRVFLRETPKKGLQMIAVLDPESDKLGYIQTKVLDYCNSDTDTSDEERAIATACRRVKGFEDTEYDIYPKPDRNYKPIAKVRGGQTLIVRLNSSREVNTVKNQDIEWVEVDLFKTPMSKKYNFSNGKTGWIEHQDNISYCS